MNTSGPDNLSFFAAIDNVGSDLSKVAREELPVLVVNQVLQTGWLTAVELNRLVLSEEALAHCHVTGRLPSLQSDRLIRILKVIRRAEQTFASRDKAHSWLRRPTSALAKNAPLDLLDTDVGSHQVENLLVRIDHGIAA